MLEFFDRLSLVLPHLLCFCFALQKMNEIVE